MTDEDVEQLRAANTRRLLAKAAEHDQREADRRASRRPRPSRALAHAAGWHAAACWGTPECGPHPGRWLRYGRGPFSRWWTTMRKLRDPWGIVP